MRTHTPLLLLLLAAILPGCHLVPDVSYQPVIYNPYPQLKKVAVAPFLNMSAEPTADGRQFALAYYNELQTVKGFEVVPVGATEQAMKSYGVRLGSDSEARRLAQVLGVDAVVVGVITDYTAYYPPRIGMHVRWYAANPAFQEIPAGYGLPFGTEQEEQIPAPLVFEAEFALAEAQLDAVTPPSPPSPSQLQPAPPDPPQPSLGVSPASHQQHVASGMDAMGVEAPINTGPIMRHTAVYNGNDADVTSALASYWEFRDEARFGGWQGYLQRSDDFIRFCCHLHISEMLSARGGAGESRVVWRWHDDR